MLHTVARALIKRDFSCKAALKSQSVRCAHSWNTSTHAPTSDQTIRATDHIYLRGLTFHGYHGVLPEENLLGQKFVVDACLFVDLAKAGQTDNVHDTVSYADVYRHIKTVVEGRPHKLLESVADQLANEILNDYRQVQGMQLHIKKPHVAVSGVVESMGIEITRYRAQS